MNQGNFMPYPIYPQIPMPYSGCSSDLSSRIDSLEKRVSTLEKYINSSNYSGSNYQML